MVIAQQPNNDSPLVQIGSLILRQDRPRFSKRNWVVMFSCEVNLSRLAKAALFDLAMKGMRTAEGILVGTPTDIDLPTTTAYRALDELVRTGVVLRTRRRLYLNPAVVFAGRVERHSDAMERWEKLRREEIYDL